MEHRAKSQIQDALRSAVGVETQARAILWRRLRDGVRSDDLAQAADDDEKTISRMTGGSCRFRLSILVALAKLDPDGGREILTLIEQELRPAEDRERPSLPETLRELAEAGAAQARSHNEAITRLADGAVSVEDLTALERLWAHEDQEREEFRDKLRAMCTERIYGLKTFGKVAG